MKYGQTPSRERLKERRGENACKLFKRQIYSMPLPIQMQNTDLMTGMQAGRVLSRHNPQLTIASITSKLKKRRSYTAREIQIYQVKVKSQENLILMRALVHLCHISAMQGHIMHLQGSTLRRGEVDIITFLMHV